MEFKFKILFPNEPFNRKQVDSAFLDEFKICQIGGIKTYFFDHEELIDNDKFVTDIDPNDKCVLIYRGWMLKPEQYIKLYHKILERTNGYVTLLNSPKQYEYLHCFPNIYNYIKGYTPKIVLLNDWETIVDMFTIKKEIDFDFFIKDHVKSIKTDKGIERIEKDITMMSLYNKVHEFIKERGNLFTNGIVFKEFVDLKKSENGTPYEWRAFFLYDKLVDMSVNINTNENIKNIPSPPKEFVQNIGNILSKRSNFFTFDMAMTEQHRRWIVLETGDGGVSGLSVNSNPMAFYNNFMIQYEEE